MTVTVTTTQDPAHRPEGWWAIPALYAAAVYCLGFVALPWPALALIGASLAVLGGTAGRHQFTATIYGDLATEAAWLGCWAGVGAGAWLISAGGHPVERWQWLAGGLVVAGGWWALICMRAPAAARVDRPGPGQPAPAGDVPPAHPYEAILRAAGVTRVTVTRVDAEAGGALDVVHVEPLPAVGQQTALTYDGFSTKAAAIATEVARHYRRDGLHIEEQDVLTQPGNDAAEYLLTVSKRRSLAGDVEYVPATSPQPWARPLPLGSYEDLRPIELSLCHPKRGASHLEIIGEAGSGKGVVLANVIGKSTESDEGEVWVVGTEKVEKLVYGWLLPWLRGDVQRPTIDRVGGPHIGAALAALADAYQFVSLTNADDLSDDARTTSRGKGGLTVIIDEAGDLLERPTTITLWDGRKMNASQLVAAIKKAGRSACVSVVTSNQDNLFESAGSAGPKSKRNSNAAIVLSVRAQQDAAQPLAGLPATVNPTKLRDNMLYIRPNIEEPRVMRGKVATLRGIDAISAVSAVNAGWRHGLDPDITRQLQWYAGRWDATLHPVLVTRCVKLGWAWPGTDTRTAEAATRADAPGPPAGDTHPAPAPPTRAGAHPLTVEDALRLIGAGEPDTIRGWIADHQAGTLDPVIADLVRQMLDQQEDSVDRDDRPPAGDGPLELPADWDTDDFDILAALGDPGDTHPAPATSSGGLLPAPDLDGIRDAGRRLVEAERARLASTSPLPDPLGLVVALLRRPGAPDWIPTGLLAVAMGRVERDADPADIRRATEQLGHELYRQTGINSEQAPRGVDAKRRRGYSRQALLDAAERLLREAG